MNNNEMTFKASMKDWLRRNRHMWILSYFIIYMPWFAYVERTITNKFHIITLPMDLKIPFCEYFIVPYLLWFVYVAFGILYFYFHNKEDYYRLCTFLFVGMTIFLIISTIYPNGHYLRPQEFSHDNLCTRLVQWLYSTDTATNLFPSIHVYNSLGIHIAIKHSDCFAGRKAARSCSLLLCVSIILSTMFLKQHSVFDVLTAFGLAAVMYYFLYSAASQRLLLTLRAARAQRQLRREEELLHNFRM